MAYKLASNYKRYRMMDAGGNFDLSNSRVSSGMGVPLAAAGVVDSVFGADNMGRQPIGAATVSGAIRGAAVGSSFGPVGTAAGALIGGATSLFSNKSQKRQNDRILSQQQTAYDMMNRNRSAAAIQQDPSLVQGHLGASFYAMGGPMETAGGTVLRKEDRGRARSRPLAENYLSRMTKAEGGSLSPMSNDSVAVNGPSHEQGGVQLPDNGAEVEGGESMKGNFVFSDRLGFADEHKRLERAIGRVQAKEVMTPEKVNAVKRMQDRVSQLALSQEYLKHILSGGQLPDPTQTPQP